MTPPSTKIPRSDGSPLQRDISWLRERLDERGDDRTLEDLHRLGTIVERMREGGRLDPGLEEFDLGRIRAMLKRLGTGFHLRNKAEQVHIVRVNRDRERAATREAPRPESLAEAVGVLHARGADLSEVRATIDRLEIQPTLTAHPTESRRRTIIQKQARIAELLATIDSENTGEIARERAASGVRRALALTLATDEIRASRPEVADEVRNGIHHLAGVIWDAVPVLHRDLLDAIELHYGARPADLPAFLRYRSWIGGDRDGNPNVTAAVTEATLQSMRRAAIERHLSTVEALHRDLSISDQRVDIPVGLQEAIDRDGGRHGESAEDAAYLAHEPFRRRLRQIERRLREARDQEGSAYRSADLLEDLELIHTSLHATGLGEVADTGLLAEAMIQVRTFGFHLAGLDLRQHSRVHESAVADLLHRAGVVDDYASMDEAAKSGVLRAELETSRPLLGPGAETSPATQELLETLRVVKEAIEREPESIGAYIVSMAHVASDLLEVLMLLREAGLWTIVDGRVECPVDVSPLFETVDDLEHAREVLTGLFADPVYARHLESRDRFQEIMLGYSDSNKDGGYWAANWRLQVAQDELSRACIDAGVEFRFFHGRGGTVARGGGRAHRAIMSSPRASRNGRIRFTEQGEVISFRYAMPALANRHLEQIANAMMLSSRDIDVMDSVDAGVVDESDAFMDELATSSRRAYRRLIDDPEFWPTFVDRSPVGFIGDLPIASRPVSRSGGDLTFDNLRAIPWVFAWTQMRCNAPGWYGIGTAFEKVVLDRPDRLEACRAAYLAGGYFRAFIDNAQQEMARSRLSVGRWYLENASGLLEKLLGEFKRAETAILEVTGQTALLDNNPVIQQSIRERNPDTDLINAIQVELLRRVRAGSFDDEAAMKDAIMLGLNALAAAMQSTG
ncbi:MAG: phosphoenolpyruvate carboxylase [Phycisphaerales bacterium]|nr:phosphoenolpyruvate carboxylase [Phycisphaerales bacterium]